MLSIGAMSASQAGYYTGLSREDYYTNGGEPPGVWIGSGSRIIGAAGPVSSVALNNLFRGLSADGSRELVQLQNHVGKQRHRPGWDLTFSAPKSVSALWSQADPALRASIQAAQFQAVREAIGYLEETAAFTRRGKSGSELERAGLLVACFEHSTSRALDPQLHTHALVLNIGVGPDGGTRTLSSLSLFESKMAAGAIYRAELAFQLRELGFDIERKRSWFEVSGVPARLIETFSKRREAIKQVLATKGIDSPQAASIAALETREAKETVSREKLFASWRMDGKAVGWSPEKSLRRSRTMLDNQGRSIERATAISMATSGLLTDQAHFTKRDFVRSLAEQAQGTSLSGAEVRALAERHLENSAEVVRLGAATGVGRYTTPAMLALEQRVLENARALDKDRSHSTSVSQRTIPNPHSGLSEEQARAVRHITTDTGAIALVSGMAGTGKTRMLTAAREIWEQQGLNVIGASLSGRATRELQEGSGIASTTIAKLFYDLDRDSTTKRRQHTPSRSPLGPDVSAPIKELARKYGPNILEPLERLAQRYGPNILAPIADLLSARFARDERSLSRLLNHYGPDIREAWRALAKHLAKTISHSNPVLTQRSVLVVDEAGMVSTPDMERLLSACRESGAKLTLVGDPKQLQPIGPGAPFAKLCTTLGNAELADIRRQSEPWARKLVKDMAAGKSQEALAKLAERGLLSVSASKEEAMTALIGQWRADGISLKDTLILASTRAEVSTLNLLAQAQRQAAGELGSRHVQVGDCQIAAGDRVMFTKTSRPRGVENGGRGTATNVDVRGGKITVQADSGQKITIALKEFPHICLGYASTVHRAQGATSMNAYVFAGGKMQDRELSYVQVSRARNLTRFFITRAEAGDAVAHLANQMQRSRQKEMAITQRDQGLEQTRQR